MSTTPSYHFNLWHYDPNIPLAIVAAICYGICAVCLTYQTVRYKTKYMYNVVAASAFEAIGYCFRIYSGQPANDSNIPVYAVTTLLLLLPPLILALGGYIAVARIITFSQTSTFIKPRVVEIFFFCVDCLAFVVQAGGGGLTAVASLADIGAKISLIGLFIGLISFLSFTVITIYVQNSSRFVFQSLDSRKQQYGYRNWRPVYIPLYINIVALLIRSIYRIIENAQGYNGYLMNHEYYFYIFDTIMILIATGSYIVWYPGRYIQPDLIMAENEPFAESQEGTPSNFSLTDLKQSHSKFGNAP